MTKAEMMILATIRPIYLGLYNLYKSGAITAAQVHSAIYQPTWGITYADFYTIVSTREPDVAKAMLRTDVANGEITPEQYEQITGEPYSA